MPNTTLPLEKRRRRLLRRMLAPDLVPDPGGWVGLGLITSVLVAHLLLLSDGARGHLFSANPLVEVAGHAWLLLGPPLSLYLGLRHLLVRGDSPVPLLTVPLSALVTAVTGAGVTLGALGA